MVPAFETSCRAMFEQIDATFQRGMTEHATAAMQHLETLNSPVTLALKVHLLFVYKEIWDFS